MVQTNDTEIISMGVDYLTVICVLDILDYRKWEQKVHQ